jgi:stress response protein YsnF
MAVDLGRLAVAALEGALRESQLQPRSGLSAGRALATGVVLGTLGRVAVRRGVRLVRQRRQEAPVDDAMTRSEEELEVHTVRRARDRVRLRKYVVTEEVHRTIPVRREEIRVEEGPSGEAETGPDTGHAEVSTDDDEIVLYQEIPVIETRVVPRERVRVVRDTHTDEAEVVAEVRKERIDLETDADR